MKTYLMVTLTVLVFAAAAESRPRRSHHGQNSHAERSTSAPHEQSGSPFLYVGRIQAVQELRGLGLSEPGAVGYIGISGEALDQLRETGKLPVLDFEPGKLGFSPVNVPLDTEPLGEEGEREVAIAAAVHAAQRMAQEHGFLSFLGLDPFDPQMAFQAGQVLADYESGDPNIDATIKPFYDAGYSPSQMQQAVDFALGRRGFVIALGAQALETHNADIHRDVPSYLTLDTSGLTLEDVVGIGSAQQAMEIVDPEEF